MIEYECKECGGKLEIESVDKSACAGAPTIRVRVTPCPTCLDCAREAAMEEGEGAEP